MQPQKLLDVDELDGDDPDSLARDKHEVKKIAVADSIQRALVDQYRTAQLLKNFAIMNYTGFIKIVKKHDKQLPLRKGRFKALTQASNICNEGKAVENLAERLELRYANWFCDGNHREAHAQLLPKRGGKTGSIICIMFNKLCLTSLCSTFHSKMDLKPIGPSYGKNVVDWFDVVASS